MIQIERHIKSIAALCRKYKVNRLFVFGSVLTDRFNDGSDIDMVVDFKKDMVFLAQALGGSVKHFP
ncbi:MAG TPA: nucleotidyltransferase domain-containing protein [Candidatus Coprenecus pullicola]|nr:nucleotidyltransferase domain-containing protein [Candidatus Coprenecus pullicola]